MIGPDRTTVLVVTAPLETCTVKSTQKVLLILLSIVVLVLLVLEKGYVSLALKRTLQTQVQENG
jgi:hypothetical protein